MNTETFRLARHRRTLYAQYSLERSEFLMGRSQMFSNEERIHSHRLTVSAF